MEEITKPVLVGIVKKEAPQLASVLREMKNVLDVVRSKVEALTALVRNLITYFCWILLY
jgi:U3 small nucleolar ribonucleoprotein protein LCP5